jgi:hypothetical protein
LSGLTSLALSDLSSLALSGLASLALGNLLTGLLLSNLRLTSLLVRRSGISITSLLTLLSEGSSESR